MKLRITLSAAAAAIVIAVFAPLFSACDGRWLPEVIEPELVSVKVGDLEVTVIPSPIEEKDWRDEEYEVSTSDFGLVIVMKTGTENKRITAEWRPAHATVTYGLAKGGTRPARFDDLRMPATFSDTDDFFFKVEDPENGKVRYYRFYPRDASPVKELSELSIAGRDANTVPRPASTVEGMGAQIANYRGTVYITRAEGQSGAIVAATPQDGENARIRYAVADSISQAQAGNFHDWVSADRVVVQDEQGKDVPQGHGLMNFTDGCVLAVEVMAQNDEANYYGFQVFTERMAIIKTLSFGGNRGVDVVAGKGTPHAVWENVVPGSYASADQPISGFAIGIVLEDEEGYYEWAVIDAVSEFNEPPSYNSDTNPTTHINNKQALIVKVHSPRDNLTVDTRFYKVEVTLKAANFTRHPKSGAYEVVSHTYPTANEPGEEYHGRILTSAQGTRTLNPPAIEPLSFKLDRTGNFTYQWYTANSWYGGYGFDQDNNMAGDPDLKPDGGDTPYNPVTNAILDKDYFPEPYEPDEKGNISYHNGGNNFYRLPYMGKPISGASGTFTNNGEGISFTPEINASNRPFITGFSNQTQYYWVVVTDSDGLVTTSDRAAIVAEWGEEFTKGVPTGKKVSRKHHIVEMHAYMPDYAAEPGLKGNPRNALPFKAGNHGDQYLIPMTFPPGFNIKDYSIVTCQALFYLADGKVWIQNWTQGDFGFADGAGERLVLWYNLTNDNATRGLNGTGNEPANSGLDAAPGNLIVQPAGTSPIKLMPPFTGSKDRYGRDIPSKAAIEAQGMTAQGWFTPYIEIVELRFEGPARTD